MWLRLVLLHLASFCSIQFHFQKLRWWRYACHQCIQPHWKSWKKFWLLGYLQKDVIKWTSFIRLASFKQIFTPLTYSAVILLFNRFVPRKWSEWVWCTLSLKSAYSGLKMCSASPMFQSGLDLPCFLRFDKPPILKRKTQEFPSFQGLHTQSFHLPSFLKRPQLPFYNSSLFAQDVIIPNGPQTQKHNCWLSDKTYCGMEAGSRQTIDSYSGVFSQAASICILNFCAVFLRSHPSKRFHVLLQQTRPVYRYNHTAKDYVVFIS